MELKKEYSIKIFLVILFSIISFGAIFNIYINYLGKGMVWDLYPYAEILWVILSVIIVLKTKTFKLLIIAVILFFFLDAWLDLVAMGHHAWWAGEPILIEWKWGIVDTEPLLQQYWFYKWTLQVPVRCLALSLMVNNPFEEDFSLKNSFLVIIFVFAGLNVIWASASHDFLFYFIWYGLYDPNYPYFHYMPPAGTWNLYNMLFIRIPIMYTIGIILILIGKKFKKIDFKTDKLEQNSKNI